MRSTATKTQPETATTLELTPLEPVGSTALAERPAAVPQAQQAGSAISMADRLLEMAIERGATMDQLDRLIDLKVKWFEHQRAEAAERAKTAFLTSLTRFKALAIKVARVKAITDGPLKGRKHATLDGVMDAVTAQLSSFDLSVTFRIVEDSKDWIRVGCVLRHIDGHSEEVVMGGPPDTGGSKNAIQARASTVRYLERYTAEAVLGVAETDELDNDGRGAKGGKAGDSDVAGEILDGLLAQLEGCDTDEKAAALWATGGKALEATKDRQAYADFKDAVLKVRRRLAAMPKDSEGGK